MGERILVPRILTDDLLGNRTHRGISKTILPGAFVFWSLFVYGKFLENHPIRLKRPLEQFGRLSISDFHITSSGAFHITSHLLATLLFMYVAYLIGNKVQRAFRFDELTGIEAVIFSMGMGLAFFIASAFVLGLVGLYYRSVVYAAGAVIVFSSLKDLRAHARALPDIVRALFRGAPNLFSLKGKNLLFTILLFVIVFQCLISLIFSLTPAMDWDSLNYHLNIPNRYVRGHAMSPVRFILPSYMPQNIHMLYTLGILCQDFVLAKNINYAIGLLLILHVYIFTKRLFNDQVMSLIAAYIMLFTPDVIHVLGLSYIDLGLGLFYMLSVDLILRWYESGERKWLTAGGAFLGLAVGSKFTVIMGAMPLFAGVLALSLYRERKNLRSAALNVTCFAALFLATLAPWLIRSLMLTGNPVYPLLYSLLGGVNFTDDLNARWNEYTATKFGFGRSIMDYLLLPWNVTVKGKVTFESFGSIVSPLWLIFIPFIAFMTRIRKPAIFFLGSLVALSCCGRSRCSSPDTFSSRIPCSRFLQRIPRTNSF